MKSTSFMVTSVAELNDQLHQHLTHNWQPNLAIVFSSIKHELADISALFKACKIEMIGCSTAGEICNDQLEEEAISVLLFNMDRSYFRTLFGKGSDSVDTYEAATEIGRQALATFERPGLIVLSGGITVDAERIVYNLRDAVGKKTPIFGGLAGDDLSLTGTYVFNSLDQTDNGLAVVVFDLDQVELEGVATSGWEPIGAPLTITEAEGNVVYKINDEPALDVFIRFFGYFDNAAVTGETISTMSAQYPLQMTRDDGEQVLRSPLMADDETRTLTLAGGVQAGETFRFSISPGFDVVEQTIADVEKFRQQSPAADALILFSCRGRKAAFGPLMEDEIEGIYQQWEGKPLIGFLSYGEIGNGKSGNCEFHNETCCLVRIKERNK